LIDVMVESIDSDVLIVGTGGAGLRAAIEADERGVTVVVVSKAPAGMNNATVVAGGGFRAAIEGLTQEEHYEDTIRVGNRINDRRLVEVFAHEGGERVLELRRFGVEMRVRRGSISVGDTPGLMGLGMTKPMVEYLREEGVRIVENVVVTILLGSEGRVVGAVGYDVRNDHPIIFRAKAVVLATGGGGALYERTDCPLRTTGDGYSLAYHAGVRLRDMEFVQFFPIALAEPGSPPFLLGGPMTEEGRLTNRLGEDIPEKHGVTARPLVLKSRGPLSVAIMREILAGNGVEGAVLLDATEVIRKHGEEDWFSSGRYAYFRDKLRAGDRPVRVAPICHFFMGGVIADEDGDTGVAGLYAAGEVVGGVHGANRHGGNALTDITVFGARAGAKAAEYAKTRTLISVGELARTELERYDSVKGKVGSVMPEELMSTLRELMWKKAGIVRDEPMLKVALAGVMGLKKSVEGVSASTAREMLVALEAPMALDVAEMIIRAALERTESRGAHFRGDYPKEDDGWMKIVVVTKGADGGMSLTTRPV
jgi:succinate dehydrogenase/fumarate reductase flavoprotein subunit